MRTHDNQPKKMRRVVFRIRIKGPTPEEVSAGYLGDLLKRFEQSVINYAKDKDLRINEEGPLLSLVDVGEGSDVLTFSAPTQVAAAIAVISGAIRKDEYEKLPRTTHSELYKISEAVREVGWGLAIEPDTGLGIEEAEIATPTGGIAPPSEPLTVTGTTRILGRCLRVGGATKAKAEVRPSRGGDLLYLNVSEEQARQLGRNLYEEVILEGTAEWEVETWRMTKFTLAHVRDFNRSRPAEAFKDLRDTAGDAWDNVDALEFVRHERGDD